MREQFRFTLRSLVLLTLLCGVAAFVYRACAPVTRVMGTTNVRLRIRVVDKARLMPIPGAQVRISDPDPRGSRGTFLVPTDGRGAATMVLPVDYSGWRSRDGEDLRLDFRQRWLEVSRPGYAAEIRPLSAVTGGTRRLSDPVPDPIEVALVEGPSPDVARDFAGSYSDMFRRLTIDPDGRFFATRLENHGYDKEFGSVRVDGSCLLITTFDREDDAPGPYRLAPIVERKYHRIRCGGRLYLIAEPEKLSFCNAVNLFGSEGLQVHDDYLAKDGVTVKPTGSVPEVPAEWKPYFLEAPLHGKITRVFLTGGASVDLGSRHGLLEGMRLYPAEGKHCILEVTEVTDAACVVRLSADLRSDRRLEKGQAVTTRYESGPGPGARRGPRGAGAGADPERSEHP